MFIKRSIVNTMLGLIFLSAILPITMSRALNSPAHTGSPRVGAANSCQEIVFRAMDSLQSSCDNVGRNKACYGNTLVRVESNAGNAVKFDAVGDRAAIRDIRRLITSPLDEQAGTWGLSLLKLQANLPDTLPGQNVTFLVFGNTSIENVSGTMSAFYFSSGLGEIRCQEVPRDAILVRSPNHTEVTFNANGVDITIASTILMRAVRNQQMSVQLIEGHARVTTSQGSQTLQPGQVVTIPLGRSNGLQPVGAPSVPVSAENDPAITPLVSVTDKVADSDSAAPTPDSPDATEPADAATTPAVSASITISGCVTAKKGNSVVINGYTINAGSSQTLKVAKIGDCFSITGLLVEKVETRSGKGIRYLSNPWPVRNFRVTTVHERPAINLLVLFQQAAVF